MRKWTRGIRRRAAVVAPAPVVQAVSTSAAGAAPLKIPPALTKTLAAIPQVQAPVRLGVYEPIVQAVTSVVVDRRVFVQGGILTGTVKLVDQILGGLPLVGPILGGLLDPIIPIIQTIDLPNPNVSVPTETFTLRRRQDFLRLNFSLYNLKLSPAGTLYRPNGNQAGILVVNLGPQHIAEETAREADGGATQVSTVDQGTIIDPDLNQPIEHRLAGASRLAFKTTTNAEIPFTLTALLAWEKFAPVVSPLAQPRAGALPAPTYKYAPPSGLQTAIEVPYRVIMSPSPRGAWIHRSAPATDGTRTELWTTRLGVRAPSGTGLADEPREQILRAVWTRDEELIQPPTGGPHFYKPGVEFSLNADQRRRLVQSTSGNPLVRVPDSGYIPEPLQVNRLMLSSLGATVDLDALFDADKSNADIISFRMRAAFGRDTFVRIVQVGYLLPFGHRAVEVDVSERKVVAGVAFLVKTKVVIPLEKTRRYNVTPAQDPTKPFEPHQGRHNPFVSATLGFDITPRLAGSEHPASKIGSLSPTGEAYLLNTGNRLELPVTLTDRLGNVHAVSMPMVFLYQSAGQTASTATRVMESYNQNEFINEADIALGRLGFGPQAGSGPAAKNDTEVETKSVRFGVDLAIGGSAEVFGDAKRSRLYPIVQSAVSKLPGADNLGATAVGWKTLVYDDLYLNAGFGNANKPKLMLRLPPGEAVALDFPLGRSGALVKPDFSIEAFSPTLGVVADRDHLATNAPFNPSTLFGLDSAKFLGVVSLKDLIAESASDDLEHALRTSERVLDGGVRETRLTWKPKLKETTNVEVSADSSLVMEILQRVDPANPSKTTRRVSAELRSVTIHLVTGPAPAGEGGTTTHFLAIPVKRLLYLSEPGQEAAFKAELGDVAFKGALKFVQALAGFLTGDEPDVRITPSGIEVGTGFMLPDLDMGVFTLRNLGFSTSLAIPFADGVLAAQFAISSPAKPFLLSVSLFGGGGYFMIELTPNGVQRLIVSLEFGANFSLDIGIASGGVYLKAGVTLEVFDPGDGEPSYVSLTGRLTMGGDLNVMGLVSISVTFDMSLTYKELTVGNKTVDKVKGRASLTVEIDVLCFSDSVTLEVERKFGNAPNDPTFLDVANADRWISYCEAFDPIRPSNA